MDRDVNKGKKELLIKYKKRFDDAKVAEQLQQLRTDG